MAFTLGLGDVIIEGLFFEGFLQLFSQDRNIFSFDIIWETNFLKFTTFFFALLALTKIAKWLSLIYILIMIHLLVDISCCFLTLNLIIP